MPVESSKTEKKIERKKTEQKRNRISKNFRTIAKGIAIPYLIQKICYTLPYTKGMLYLTLYKRYAIPSCATGIAKGKTKRERKKSPM